MVPILLAYREKRGDSEALRLALDHMALTHPGPEMRQAGQVFGELFLAVLKGADLEAEIRKGISRCNSALWRFPYQDWLKIDDLKAIGPAGFSPAAYVDQALPAVIYLALKYAHDPEKALIANTNAGGDNAYRGAILGALLGAANGDAAWPQRWVDGLAALPVVEKFFAPPVPETTTPVDEITEGAEGSPSSGAAGGASEGDSPALGEAPAEQPCVASVGAG